MTNFIQKLEGEGKKFISILDRVAIDAEKGLVETEKYAIPAANFVALLFPEVAPEIGVVETAINLIQNSVLEVKAKASVLPKGMTPDEMLADELHLVGPAAVALLNSHAKISNITEGKIGGLIKIIVALLNAKEAA